MARTSKTSPFQPRAQAEPRTNAEDENREVAQTEPKTDEDKISSSNGAISDAQEVVSERESKRMRSLEDIYSATERVEGNVMGEGNKPEIDTTVKPKRGRGRPPKRGRGRPRGSKTKAPEIDTTAKPKRGRGRPRGSKNNAGQKGKGKKQEETDVSQGSEPDLEEVCKGFKGRNDDDDSDDNDGTGGGGEAHKNLSSLGLELVA